jgi:hypothetical protein
MAKTARQTAIFGVEDWKRLYQTFREADFQSYDFETLRKSFIDYLRVYYPETFNDYIESSEFIALLDVIAFIYPNSRRFPRSNALPAGKPILRQQ